MDDHSKDDLPSGSKELKKANSLGPGDSSDESCGPNDQTDMDEHSKDDLPSGSKEPKKANSLGPGDSSEESCGPQQRPKASKLKTVCRWTIYANPGYTSSVQRK
ncbi:hypothetical protein KR018_011917 [Drosophila ironensis]|nr:hypothetical protein KR018_011917 [Drosophila ironensis]